MALGLPLGPPHRTAPHLRDLRVARERVRVLEHRLRRRALAALGDAQHGAPLGKARSLFVVRLAPEGQAGRQRWSQSGRGVLRTTSGQLAGRCRPARLAGATWHVPVWQRQPALIPPGSSASSSIDAESLLPCPALPCPALPCLATCRLPGAQVVEALRAGLAVRSRQHLQAGVDLDPGHDALGLEHVNKLDALVTLLVQRLLKHDGAADVLPQACGARWTAVRDSAIQCTAPPQHTTAPLKYCARPMRPNGRLALQSVQ